MTFDEYAKAAMRTAAPTMSKRDALTLSALGLCGEAGEFVDLWKKISYHNHPMDATKLCEELGDILWYVNSLGRHLGFTLEEIAKTNLEKLADRRKRNVIRGNGDNR